MFRILDVTWFDIWVSFVISLVLIVIGLIIFQLIWINKVVFTFPAGGYEAEAGDVSQDTSGLLKVTARSLIDHFGCIFRRIFPLDRNYWVHYAGFDGTLSLKQPTAT